MQYVVYTQALIIMALGVIIVIMHSQMRVYKTRLANLKTYQFNQIAQLRNYVLSNVTILQQKVELLEQLQKSDNDKQAEKKGQKFIPPGQRPPRIGGHGPK